MNRFLVATCVGAIVAGSIALSSAQQSATLTLRSGSPLSGELVDLGGSGFTFRVNGEDRSIPRGDVESIDFGGGGDVPEAARTLAGGTNLLVLRNGDLVQGEFYDVNGANPIRLTFRTSTGERQFAATEVRQVYMTRVGGGTAAGGGTSSQPSMPGDSGAGRTVRVSARTAWTPTGVTVRQGTTVRFDSSGDVTFAPNQTASTAGNNNSLMDSRAPLPGALQGALVARIGSTGRGGGGQAFAIGNQRTVVMPATGQLFLGINDSNHDDNSGEFTVVIVAPR